MQWKGLSRPLIVKGVPYMGLYFILQYIPEQWYTEALSILQIVQNKTKSR